MTRRRWGAGLTALSTGLAMWAVSPGSPASAAPASSNRTTTVTGTVTKTATSLGTVNIRAASNAQRKAAMSAKRSAARSSVASTVAREVSRRPERELAFPGGALTRAGAAADTAVQAGVAGAIRAWDGLNAADSRLARDGNQFTTVPPDGAMCQGGGASVEMVNSALQFSDRLGNLLTAPIALSSFYGLPPSVDRTTDPRTFPGPLLSDPRCLYDQGSGRHMILVWGLSQDPATGAFTGRNTYFLAVQATPDPLGSYFRYAIDVDPVGTAGCAVACEADFPMIGSDANAVVISWNSFGLDNTGGVASYNGGRLIALSKRQLTTGHAPRPVLYRPGGQGGQPIYTLQPAAAPPGGSYDGREGGTEWLLATIPADNGDNRVVLGALTGTSTINSGGRPRLQLTLVGGVLPYTHPPEILQKPGARPLGAHLRELFGVPNEPLAKLDPGPDKASSVEWAAGRLWTSISTGVAGGAPRDGQLLLAIAPGFTAHNAHGSVAAQKYLAVAGASLSFADIAVSADGRSAAVVASISGRSIYPSAVVGRLNTATLQSQGLTVYKHGAGPADNFDCYAAFGGSGVCRWGDYSEINVGDDGGFYMETVYITDRLRVPLANWGTALARLPL